jgi:hypothetical protein
MERFALHPEERFGKEQAQGMLARYAATLSEMGCEPRPYADLDAIMPGSVVRTDAKRAILDHALWMCEESARFIDSGRWAKAHRWIGMIQGLMFQTGVYSISDLKDHNRDVWPRERPDRVAYYSD